MVLRLLAAPKRRLEIDWLFWLMIGSVLEQRLRPELATDRRTRQWTCRLACLVEKGREQSRTDWIDGLVVAEKNCWRGRNGARQQQVSSETEMLLECFARLGEALAVG